MREIIVELNDGRHFVIEAEGKDVAWIATQGAAQTDEHRDGLWTLKQGRRIVPPSDPIEQHFSHGQHATLHLIERHARVTPIGSTHPDDRTPPAPDAQVSRREADGAGALSATSTPTPAARKARSQPRRRRA